MHFLVVFNDPATPQIYTLSLHDALPISLAVERALQLLFLVVEHQQGASLQQLRSEEHTSELQSQSNLVCRPLLEKKNNMQIQLDSPLKRAITPPEPKKPVPESPVPPSPA